MIDSGRSAYYSESKDRMKTHTLKQTAVPLDDSWDVIVAGGGPAGSAAAASAAREGARTLLIEATGCLGGMGTSGLVPAWCPFTDYEKIIYGGLAECVFTECKKGIPHVPDEQIHGWVPLNSERLKRIYDDLAAWAGAEFTHGDESGQTQPGTLCFVLSNVDDYAYVHGRSMDHKDPEGLAYDILRSEKYPLACDYHLCQNLIGPSTAGFNAGHIWNLDATDPACVSAAMMHGRRIAAQLRDALAEFRPDVFGNAYLAATASLMGVRESRLILGDYVLTLDDYLARRSFPDEIARNAYFIDIHAAKDEIERNQSGEDVVGQRVEHYGPGESHGIPYRCLTPRGLRNVLVAGRSLFCDRIVHGSVRVMPVCLVMGEAAGMAAAHAVTNHAADVHAVDTDRLRARLREENAYLPD
jgi:hypothetical protein